MTLLLVLAGCGAQPAPVSPDTEVPTEDSAGETPQVTEPTACGVGPMFVRGGMGATSFTPLEAGDGAGIYHGPAGGWWVDTAIDVANSSGTVSIQTTVTLLETGQVISGLQGAEDVNLLLVRLWPTGDCRGESWGVRAFLNDFTPGDEGDWGWATIEDICALDGQPARIAWTVTDLVGEPRVAETSVDVVLASDPYDAVLYCAADPTDTGAPDPR